MSDTLGYRKVFGVVVPSPNTVIQPEFDDMRPAGVTNQTARIMTPLIPLVDDASFIRHVETMRSGIIDAVDRVTTSAPDHLIMGLSLEAFWDGLAGSERLLSELESRTGLGVSMGSNAIVAALAALGAGRRLAIVTPHLPIGNERVRTFFSEAGYEVVRLAGLAFQSGLAIAKIGMRELADTVRQIDGSDVDTIVQVGTNLPMARLAGAAELWLQKPVIAINTATYWHALRANNIADPIEGFGSLLVKH